MQKLINGVFEDFNGELVDGDVYRIPVGGKLVNGVLTGNGWEQKTFITEAAAIPITITGITGALQVDSGFTRATALENTNVTIAGTLAIPDQSFNVPIRRNDGRLFIFGADVVSGAFTIVLNFPTCGAFVYSDSECNKDLPPNTFTIQTINFDIQRKIEA